MDSLDPWGRFLICTLYVAPQSPDSFKCPTHGFLSEHQFYNYKTGHVCKICKAIKSKNYYKENESRIKKRIRNYRIRNIEKIKLKGKAFRTKNKERLKIEKQKYLNKNKEKISIKRKEYQKKNKKKLSVKKKKYWKENKEELSAKKKIYRTINAVRIAEVKKLGEIRVRLGALRQYSNGKLCCALCKETNLSFLCLDHIEGGGTRHRKLNSSVKGKGVYWWVKKNNYPPIFRVLCYNCNFYQIKRTQSNKKSAIHQKYRLKLKTEVFNHYSNGKPICAICQKDNIDILTIDHINGGGRKHLIAMKIKGGVRFYKYLKDNKFPEGYRVLCMNCNCSQMTKVAANAA